MSVYKNLSGFKGDKLWVVASGWFNPTYALTDGENQYGTIRHEGLFSSTSILETASCCLAALGAYNGDISLKTEEGKVIGYGGTTLFKPGLSLTLNNGSTYMLTQPNIWRAAYTWVSEVGDYIMHVDGNILLSLIFSADKPFSEIPDFHLLVFTSVKYLVYLNSNAS